jgi:hypothetical protein
LNCFLTSCCLVFIPCSAMKRCLMICSLAGLSLIKIYMKVFDLEQATLDAGDLQRLKLQMIKLVILLSIFLAIPIGIYFISPEALAFSVLAGMMALGLTTYFFMRASGEWSRIKSENKKIILTGTLTEKSIRAKKFGRTEKGLPDTLDHYYFYFGDHEQEVLRKIFKRYEVGQKIELQFVLLKHGHIKFEYLRHRLIG